MIKPIHPCLWFDGKAKKAAEYYCSIFPNSNILSENPMVVMFQLDGNTFMGLNGGSLYQFTEATSFVITCKDQAEIDHFWNSLTADGGSESMCGWLKDKFGVSWQVVPYNLGEIFSHPENGHRAMQAMFKMKKLEIDVLVNA